MRGVFLPTDGAYCSGDVSKHQYFPLMGEMYHSISARCSEKVHPPFDEWHSIRVAWPEKCPPSAGTPYYEEGDMTTCAMTVCT
jgi:hypothetical protein